MGSAELILFGALLMAGISVFQFLSVLLGKSNADKEALSWATGNEPVKSKSPLVNSLRPLVHQFTLKYAVKIKNESRRKRVQRMILTGGLSRELNVDEFMGIQLLAGIFIPLLLFVLNFALELGLPEYLIIFLGVMGYMFPILYARSEKTRRERSVRLDLPFFTDLLALSTEAGLDFVGSIQRITDKADASSVLAEEFATVLQDIKLGASRSDALRALADRLDMNEMTSFVGVLVDADSTGASISQVLKDQSIQMRLERFVRAEKAGAQASQAILLPIMLFILPAVFIMVFGPIIIQFMSGGG
jgi:tight adherence protein C